MEPLKPRAHPSSLIEFHQRLRSYKLSSYPAGKPRGLSPPSMAANGWFNVQKNRLRCDACGSSWVLATPSKGDWSTNSGKQLAELGIRLRTDKHQVSCPWRSRRFPSSIYRATRWNTSTEAAKSLFRVAERFQSSVFHDGQPSIQLEHPLSNSDVTALTTAVSILLSSTLNKKPASNSTSTSTVSEQCLILALFGWDIKSLTTITLSSQLETCMSLRTSQTVAPSSLNQPTSKATDSNNNLNSTEELEIISCSLCHRQVIFSRLTQPFNVLTEHRDYCPNFDSRCGFEDLEPALTTWQILLGLIKKFIERQGGQPSTLEEVVERFKSLNQCKSPQTGVLNFVRDALTTSSISKLS
ncbi:C3HC zinc finger-like-domain-containing protein [Phakopsora pachyrhizi]|nr:C3HC zinc finger-like-domain-containing protein [Phakopsora pachyrhizi]